MHHLPIHPRHRHPLTGEPLRAVGIGKRGPIWPIMGASEPTPVPQDGPPPDSPPDPEPAKDSDALGDAGKKALDAERKEKRAAEKRAADLEARLKEFEDRDKSEAEKAADRIAKAEAEVASVPTKVSEALRAHLVGLHKISDEDAELFLTATDPEVLLKQVDRLVARNSEAADDRRRRGNHVASEGLDRGRDGASRDPRSADLAQIEADLAANRR